MSRSTAASATCRTSTARSAPSSASARAPTASTLGLPFELAPLDVLTLDEQIGHVILVDVAHVGDRLTADALAGDTLDVVEPEVGVEAAAGGFAPQPADARRAGVV